MWHLKQTKTIWSKPTTASTCPPVFTEALGLTVAPAGYWWRTAAEAKRCTATWRPWRMRQRDAAQFYQLGHLDRWSRGPASPVHLVRSQQKAFGTWWLPRSSWVNQTFFAGMQRRPLGAARCHVCQFVAWSVYCCCQCVGLNSDQSQNAANHREKLSVPFF